MIASIFSKSKPINFLIVFFITLIALFAALYFDSESEINALSIFKSVPVFIVCYLSILLLDFIVNKNSLSQKSNFEVVLFSVFVLAIPQLFLHQNLVFSNLIILLAFRRIISIQKQKETLKKLFDSGFLIGLASLFYFWSILFFVLIFVAIFFYAEAEVKKLITPFLGLISIYVVAITYSLIVDDTFFSAFTWSPNISFDLSAFNSAQFIIAITMLLSFGLWSSIFYLRGIKNKKKSFRPSYSVIFSACLIASSIIVIAPNKNGSEFLFLFAPLAVIITNYIETIEEKWFKEVFLFALLVIPFILLFL